MSYFEQNNPFGLQRFAEKDQGKIQEQMKKKKSPYLPRALILVFATVVAISIAYLFWPSVKGGKLTETASALLNGDVSLTGIIYSEENPMAIVNGKIVHKGDAVGDVKVVKIYKNGVELEKSGRKWSQSLPATEEGVHSGSSGLPVLLVLGSEGCKPCRQMKPILNKLKSKYAKKFEVRYIDVWKNEAAGTKYGVRVIPTQIFYDSKGQEVFRNVGFCSEDEILAIWNDIGIKL
jgi:thiol-disulfide isomerase/thioredoxin